MNSKQHPILALTRDVDTESTLKLLFEGDTNVGEVSFCKDLDELVRRLAMKKYSLVLVDIDADATGLLDKLEPIINQNLETRFTVLTRELASDLVMRAMQAGVRYVQMKDQIASELPGVVRRMLESAPIQAGPTGSAITVLSAGGGAGCTTIVVNLANELQLTTSLPVLVADLDYAYGAVATYLELEGEYGIADVLEHDGVIDSELIHTTSVRHSDSLRALLSPASVHFGEHAVLKEDRLDETIRACRQGHRFTLFDAARVSMDAAATLAKASEVTLVVLQPMVKDIRVTRNMIQALLDRGVESEKIKPVLNRYRKRREAISVDEAQKALCGLAPECLSNDYTSAARGINYGQLLSSSAPRSALRKDVVNLAERFSAEKRNGNKQEPGGDTAMRKAVIDPAVGA